MMWLRTIGWLRSLDGCPALPPHPVPGTPWAQGTPFPGAVLGLSRLRSGHGNGWGLSPEKHKQLRTDPSVRLLPSWWTVLQRRSRRCWRRSGREETGFPAPS